MNKTPLAIAGVLAVLLSPIPIRWMHSSVKAAVAAEPVRSRSIRDSVLASGSLIYKDQALLSPEVIGRVTQVLVREGQHVEPGQIILRIDDSTYRDAVAQQLATLDLQQRTVERQALGIGNQQLQFQRVAALIDKGFATRTNYDTATYNLQTAQVDLRSSRANVAQARAALQQAQEMLAKTVIRSPIAGTVVLVGIKAGETAVPSAIGIPGSSLVTVADKSSIMADLNVDENDIAHLRVGQSARIHCPTAPDRGLAGTIASIALAPRRGATEMAMMANAPNGRSYSVKLTIHDPAANALLPGMNCRAQIFTSNPPPMPSVPVQAVMGGQADGADGVSLGLGGEAPAAQYVFVVDRGVARRRKVRLGASDDQMQQVVSGVRAGEAVITGPYRVLHQLADGDGVNLRKAS